MLATSSWQGVARGYRRLSQVPPQVLYRLTIKRLPSSGRWMIDSGMSKDKFFEMLRPVRCEAYAVSLDHTIFQWHAAAELLLVYSVSQAVERQCWGLLSPRNWGGPGPHPSLNVLVRAI